MRQSWAVYCAAPQGEQYSAQRKFTACVSPATRQPERPPSPAARAPEPKRFIRTVWRQSPDAGGHRSGGKKRQPQHP